MRTAFPAFSALFPGSLLSERVSEHACVRECVCV